MTELTTSAAVVHHAGTGPGTWAMDSLFEHLVSADRTDGRLGDVDRDPAARHRHPAAPAHP